MSEEDVFDYISKLWAMLIWGNKHYRVDKILEENGFDNFKSRLADLEGTSTTANPAAPVTKSQPAQKPDGPLPVMEWGSTEHDFGTIKEGDKVNYTYKFKNTGAIPLIIESVRPSCGCTAPNWTKEPIPVGGEGFVEVVFDSTKKPNAQNKTVTVTANTWPQSTVLRFKAFVTPAAK